MNENEKEHDISSEKNVQNKIQAEHPKSNHAAFNRIWYEHNKGTGCINNGKPVPDCNTHTTNDTVFFIFFCNSWFNNKIKLKFQILGKIKFRKLVSFEAFKIN